MSHPGKQSTVWISVGLDPETADRLRDLSDACCADEESVAASLLRDILKDDAEAHFLLAAPGPSAAHH